MCPPCWDNKGATKLRGWRCSTLQLKDATFPPAEIRKHHVIWPIVANEGAFKSFWTWKRLVRLCAGLSGYLLSPDPQKKHPDRALSPSVGALQVDNMKFVFVLHQKENWIFIVPHEWVLQLVSE